ncbi:MAG: T9SS type A sorting domain-containing protein [bacterium]
MPEKLIIYLERRIKMRTLLKIILLTVIIFVNDLFGLGTWESLNGPPAGYANCVLSDPLEDNKVWASVDSFLYLSTNNGEDWELIPHPPGVVFDIEIGYNGGRKYIFLATSAGILRSIDDVSHWEMIYQGAVSKISLKPRDLSIIYASSGLRVMKSEDLGNTWQVILTLETYIEDICVWTGNVQHIFVASRDGLYMSPDAGGSWQNIGLLGKAVRAVNVYQEDDNVILAGCDWLGYGARYYAVYKTTDGGTNWTEVLELGFDGQTINAIKNSPLIPQNVIVGCDQYSLYKSTDYGETWVPVWSMGQFKSYADFSYSSFEPNLVFCACKSSGIFRSEDNGDNWDFVTRGMKPRIAVEKLAIGETDARIFAMGSIYPPPPILWQHLPLDGILHTPNHGIDWRYWTDPPGLLFPRVRRVPNGLWYLSNRAFGADFYRSTDNGFTWIPTANWTFIGITDFDVFGSDTIYAAIGKGGPDWVGKSTDGGYSWAFYSPAEPLEITSIKVSPNNSQRVYIGGQRAEWFFISTDGGSSWQLANQGLPVVASINNITSIATTNDTLLLVAINGQEINGIYRSENQGEQWYFSNLNVPANCIIPDPIDPSVFYTATDQGFFISADFGKNWSGRNNGLPIPHLYDIKTFSSMPIIYGGTPQGIYRYKSTHAISGEDGATAYQSKKLVKVNNGFCLVYTSPGGVFTAFLNETGELQIRKMLGSGELPTIWLDAQGNPCAIWQRNIEPTPVMAGGELWFSRFDGTNWTEPYLLGSFIGSFYLDVNLPSFTIDPTTNKGYVVFELRDHYMNGPSSHLYLGWFSINNPLDIQFTELEFAPNPERCEFPSITQSGNYLYIAFQREHTIYRIKWDIVSQQIVDRRQISEDGKFSHHPYCDAQANGRINYVWEDSTAENIEIYWAYELTGSPSSPKNVSRTPGKSQWPQICKGTTWITWSEFIYPPTDNNWEICYKDLEYEGYNILSQTLGMSKYSHGVVYRSPYWPPPYEPKLTAIWTEGNESPYEVRAKTVSLPEISYFYVDAGKEEPSPWTVQREGYIQFGAEPEKTIDYHSQKLIYHFPNLNPARRYRIKLVFYFESQGQNRWKMKIDGDNIFHANIWLKPNEIMTLERWLPTACYKDGEVYLNITKVIGDYALVAQVFIYEYEREIEQMAKNTQESGSSAVNKTSLFITPNPVHSVATITYAHPIDNQAPATIKIYDASGRLVKSFNHLTNTPVNQVIWNGTDETGKIMSNGIYFVVLKNDKECLTQKLILLR